MFYPQESYHSITMENANALLHFARSDFITYSYMRTNNYGAPIYSL